MSPPAPHGILHFVFPDGILAYDCVKCGGRCCQGHNSTIDGNHELVQLLRHRPELAPFVFREQGKVDEYAMQTFAPACALLDDDHRCSVETALGRSTKPVTCRLFPVDRFTPIGKYLFVDVHFLCPLGLQIYSGETAYPVDYASTERDLAEVCSLDVVTHPREQTAVPLHALADLIVDVETELRALVIEAFPAGDLRGCLERFRASVRRRAPAGVAIDPPPADPDTLFASLDAFWGIQRAPLAAAADLRLRQNLLALVCSIHHKVVMRQQIRGEADLLRWSSRLPAMVLGIEYLFRNVVSMNPARNEIDPLKDVVIRNALHAYLLGSFLRRLGPPRRDPPAAAIPAGLEEWATTLIRSVRERTAGGERPQLARLLDLPLAAPQRGTTTRWLSTTLESLLVWSDADAGEGAPAPAATGQA